MIYEPSFLPLFVLKVKSSCVDDYDFKSDVARHPKHHFLGNLRVLLESDIFLENAPLPIPNKRHWMEDGTEVECEKNETCFPAFIILRLILGSVRMPYFLTYETEKAGLEMCAQWGRTHSVLLILRRVEILFLVLLFLCSLDGSERVRESEQ